jgi:hypothetical protein
MKATRLLGGDAVIHDWNWLLNDMHILKWTYVISSTLDITGFIVIVLGMILSFTFALSPD